MQIGTDSFPKNDLEDSGFVILVKFAAEMEEAVSYLYQVEFLLRENTIAQLTLWPTSIIAGILMCKIVYDFMKLISPLYFKGYLKLTKAEQIEWNNRGFSTFHAILVSGVSIYVLFFSDLFCNNAQDEPITHRNSLFSSFILGVSIGYFLSDLGMILWHYPSLGGKEYVLHHALSIFSIAISLCTGQAHIYVYMILLSESTTPFVNLRWYLDMAGLKKSKAYVINGIAMFCGWLVARIILFTFFFSHMYLYYHQVRKTSPVIFYSLFSAPPLLALMNLFWFWRIAMGLKKTLSKRHDY
eukprot:Gb_19173 [translate_table: standard]